MPQTAMQLVSDSCLEAKTPGYLAFAGRKLNMILADLCSYDIDVTRGVTQFVFQPGIADPLSIGSIGSGPYPLPTDWLRANRGDVFYIISGVKYEMYPISMSEWDALVSQGGLNAYPEKYAVDNSPQNVQGAPLMYVWPPPSGAFPVMLYSGDDRASNYLNGSKGSFLGASEILRRWLQTQGDDQVVKTIELDRRRFGPRFRDIPNTKNIGW